MITKKKFERYLKVQDSGVTDMWAISRVGKLAKLSEDDVTDIITHYGDYKEKYEKKLDVNKLWGINEI